ncbi:MAG: hypothetical protein MI919_22790 [Holophagales bacterium]|nr:hypothetical protein [Holophagales bacterium]
MPTVDARNRRHPCRDSRARRGSTDPFPRPNLFSSWLPPLISAGLLLTLAAPPLAAIPTDFAGRSDDCGWLESLPSPEGGLETTVEVGGCYDIWLPEAGLWWIELASVEASPGAPMARLGADAGSLVGCSDFGELRILRRSLGSALVEVSSAGARAFCVSSTPGRTGEAVRLRSYFETSKPVHKDGGDPDEDEPDPDPRLGRGGWGFAHKDGGDPDEDEPDPDPRLGRGGWGFAHKDGGDPDEDEPDPDPILGPGGFAHKDSGDPDEDEPDPDPRLPGFCGGIRSAGFGDSALCAPGLGPAVSPVLSGPRAFRLEVASFTTVHIASEGRGDVAAELLDAWGHRLAFDDDGGAGRNFRLAASLAPGLYLLRIRDYRGDAYRITWGPASSTP